MAKTPEVPLSFENANFYGVQHLSPRGVPRRMRWGAILVENLNNEDFEPQRREA
jgi:hypothetical protein